MSKLQRIVCVMGDQNAGKTTLLNMLILKVCNSGAYGLLERMSRQGICNGWNAKDLKRFRHEKIVALDLPNAKKGTLRRVVVATAGDTQDRIRKAFMFAESCQAEVLVCSCRSSNAALKLFFDLCCDVRLISYAEFRLSQANTKDVLGFFDGMFTKTKELFSLIRNEAESPTGRKYDVEKSGRGLACELVRQNLKTRKD